MKLFAPEYYKKFSCIADKCKHSCCIGWEIDIDEKSAEGYAKLSVGYGDAVRKSVSTEGGAHFEMMDNGRCPHLDSHGLCRLITDLGEDMLCDICREHPRFYNVTPRGAEVGVGAACEAAAKLILDSDGYDVLSVVGEYRAEPVATIDPAPVREMIYSLLKDGSLPYPKRLEAIYERCEVSPSVLSDETWRDIIRELEYLTRVSPERFSCYSSDPCLAKDESAVLSRFLAYLVYRHTGECESEDELRRSLGFAFFLERLLASLIENEGAENKYELARLISEELEYSEDNVESIMLEFL